MHATLSIGCLILALSAFSANVRAFHVESGTPCTTVGSACSCRSLPPDASKDLRHVMLTGFFCDTDISNDSTGGGAADTTVHGYCAPDLHCASNGATCANDDECYNYCGRPIYWKHFTVGELMRLLQDLVSAVDRALAATAKILSQSVNLAFHAPATVRFAPFAVVLTHPLINVLALQTHAQKKALSGNACLHPKSS